MRVLFIHTGSDLYGASRCLLRLATRMVKDSDKVHVVLPYDGPLNAALESGGVNVLIEKSMPLLTRDMFRNILSPFRLLLRSLVFASRLCRMVSNIRPDLIHVNTATVLPASLPAAWLYGCRHTLHVRESFGEFGGLWRVLRAVFVMSFRRIICVSQYVAGQFKPDGKVCVINDGIPADEFDGVTSESINVFRKQHGFEGRPSVGVVGRIKIKRKGQETFIKAAALVAEKYPEAVFLLIGSPFPGNESHLTDVLGLAEKLGIRNKVIYTGDVKDVKSAISALDVPVMSSGQPEPFSNFVIESMALSRCIVGTSCGGTSEQIEDGVTGVLVPPNDPESMAAAICRLLADKQLQVSMGAAGRNRYMANFEFEPYYRKMCEVYQQR